MTDAAPIAPVAPVPPVPAPSPVPGMAGRAAELRLAFDRAFAEPARQDTAATTALLAIRVGAEAWAMRISEITGLCADKTISRLPGSDASLLGVAGFRGVIVPVYGLQALLLGRSPAPAPPPPPRWLVMAAAAPVALAFEALEGQLSVAPDAITAAPGRGDMHAAIRDFVRARDCSAPILHIPSLVEAIKARRGEALTEER